MKLRYTSIALFLFCSSFAVATNDTNNPVEPPKDEDPNVITNTFADTRLINGHTTDLLGHRKLDVRITHRFGDISGDNGGVETLFGSDFSSDIRIAFEYGLTNKLNIGIGRSKGAGPLTQIMDGYIKYRPFTQTKDNKVPVSVTLVGSTGFSLMKASEDLRSPSSFRETAHRFSYVSQLLISRKFGDRASIMVAPGYVHRNYVAFGDENSFLSVGIGGTLRMTKVMSLMAEYHTNLVDTRTVGPIEYTEPLSFGLQFDTGGHIFTLVVSNARGINETQFIPYTSSQYGEGQFRYGFTISRQFQL